MSYTRVGPWLFCQGPFLGQNRSFNCVKKSLTIFAYPLKQAGNALSDGSWLQNQLLRVLLGHNRRGQAHMTCCIDHEAENAIPLFLCTACNRETIAIAGHSQALNMANAICATVERGQGAEPAAHVR